MKPEHYELFELEEQHFLLKNYFEARGKTLRSSKTVSKAKDTLIIAQVFKAYVIMASVKKWKQKELFYVDPFLRTATSTYGTQIIDAYNAQLKIA